MKKDINYLLQIFNDINESRNLYTLESIIFCFRNSWGMNKITLNRKDEKSNIYIKVESETDSSYLIVELIPHLSDITNKIVYYFGEVGLYA